MNYLIIPDIHGEVDLLNQILEKFPEHHYVFLGDLIDRGPDSPSVVSEVIELCKSKRAVLCRGNHEDMMVAGLAYGNDVAFSSWISNGGDATVNQYFDLKETPELLWHHVEWIRDNSVHWHVLDTPHGKILCSHASRPTAEELAEVPPTESTYSLESDLHLWSSQLLRTDNPLPDGFLCSVHGHVPQVKPVPYPKFIEDYHLLDIGSCFNGRIAVLDTADMKYHTFSTWKNIGEQYNHSNKGDF